MKFPEKKAYIFDLFHTLTDNESKWATLPTTSEYLKLDKEKYNELLHSGSKERLCGFIKDEFAIIKNIVIQIDPDISDEKIRKAIRIRKKRFEQALINIPAYTISTLKKLKSKGIALGLLSNADVMEKAMWHKSPIANLFDSTIFSCDVGYAKPDEEIYKISLDQLNVSPEEAFFIGDGGSNELEGAGKVGITTVLVTGIIKELWPEKIPARRKWADFEIEYVSDLI